METRHANLTILALIAATLVYEYVLNPHLPAVIPSHWNIHGQADGFSPKETVYFLGLLPLLMIALVINILPRLRVPAGMNPSQAIGNYISAATAIFLFYVNLVMLQFALHPALPLNKFVWTGMLLLFMLLGNVLGKTRRNPWSGIKTPWTLASDSNWIATHRMAGRLWVGVSLLGLLLLWLGLPLTLLLPAVLLPLIVVPVVYSYLLFKRSGSDQEEPA